MKEQVSDAMDDLYPIVKQHSVEAIFGAMVSIISALAVKHSVEQPTLDAMVEAMKAIRENSSRPIQ
jgi:mevalonate kinase